MVCRMDAFYVLQLRYNKYSKENTIGVLEFLREKNSPDHFHWQHCSCLSLHQDEASANLMIYTRSFIRKLGSSYIDHVKWRDMWAFVMQRINNEKFVYAEGFQRSADDHDWAYPVTIHTTVPLRPQSVLECSWKDNEENRRRKEFCGKLDGYGGICKCEYITLVLCFATWEKHRWIE